GGTLAPGSAAGGGTLTVNGNVTFNPGSFYAVAITPEGASSSVAVTGQATLSGGTVVITPALGTYASRSYSILTTTGGLGGTRFSDNVAINGNVNFSSPVTLDYTTDPGNVDLNVAAGSA